MATTKTMIALAKNEATMTVDWEGLKALRVKANAIDATIPEVDRYTLALISEFPAILAQHERDQRVIEAALDPNTLRYGAWIGSVELDDGVCHGKILHIKDLVMYEATSEVGLHDSFVNAVHDYLQTCMELGDDKEMITSLQGLAELDKAKQ